MSEQQKTILLVEDEEAHAALITRAFEDHHASWQLQHVKTLKEAKSILAGQQPDLMLLDNRLPDGEGLELLPGTVENRIFPIIMMTAYGDEKVAVNALKFGALDYVVKSDSMFAEMPHMAERALREWEYVTQNRHAEMIIQMERKQAQTYLDIAGVMFCVLDSKGDIKLMNRKGAEILCCDENETIGKNWFELFISDDIREEIKGVFDQLMNGEIDPVEYYENEVITKTGKRRIIAFHNTILRDEQGKPSGVLFSGEDITEQKEAEAALRQFEHIVSSSTDMMAMLDSGFTYLSANPAYMKAFNKTQDEMIGHTVAELFGEQFFNEIIRPKVERCLAGEEVNYQTWFDFPNSKTLYMDIHYYPYLVAENKVAGYIANARDITDQKRSEQRTLRQEVQAKRILETALDAFIQIDADGLIREWNPHAELIFGWKKEEVLGHALTESIIPQGNRQQHEEGIKHFLATGEGAVLNKVIEIEALHSDGHLLPIELSIVVEKDNGDTYFNAFLRDITDKNRACDELLKSHFDLKDSLAGTVGAISKAVEARDPYTAGHQQRVAEIACAIAEEMGLDEGQIEGIRMGASIHDIGKIQTPAELLSKPTQLTKFEFQLIKEHTTIGYDILKDIKFPWPVADIAHQHHERVDGSGYPQGLKGDEICLEARIVAVADVVEAISSHRPYRAALGIDFALDEIKAKRGIFYDPEAVDACLKAYEDKRFSV
ncbi:PAS domain S-box-containing protein/HDIG domain-containing protein [Mariprofundus aestuarium]|uniref:PAS domain S-box-containing protein/HDIG domain-containing protein n=1 Tax=Mariprofundus aestuarium TaxID=1921086 RepID=A0A2K8KXV6_MARES|nr:PAS domain S-box protein [Mariprofundus aestuarium]ATX79723.1 PAS domain S-box-containing protein/HDIG domain-containing protein [Mariprofundus aestuarium]